MRTRKLHRGLSLVIGIVLGVSPLGFAQSPASWTAFSTGTATDVGAGANGSLWAIGTKPAGSPDKSIFRWAGSAWQQAPGGAVRIAVDPAGSAWIVNSGGTIYRWSTVSVPLRRPIEDVRRPTSPTAPTQRWQQMPGAARDIGIGANGAVWIVGTDGALSKWNGTGWDRLGSGGGTRIAVDPAGNPWITNDGNEIWRWTGAAWQLMPGNGRDIAIGPDGAVYVIGMTSAAGGFQVWRWAGNGPWTLENGVAGTNVAAGPAPVAYVAQDATAGSGLFVRSIAASPPALAGGTITLTSPTTIPVTSFPVTTSGSTTGSVTSGTLVTSSGSTVPGTTGTSPIVVQGLSTQYSPPPSLPQGTLICPIIGAGARLVKGCLFEGSTAVYISKAPSECDSGQFPDPRNGGECWSCSSGFIRNVSPVDSGDACWKAVSENLSKATRVGATGCPSGSFSDPRNGGECWQCPSGFNRTWDPVTAGTACSKSWAGPFSAATYKGKPGQCTGGSFWDPLDGGTCWTCPAGYRRTANPVTGTAACAQTVPTQYQTATYHRKAWCGDALTPVGYGAPFRDPRNGGECWTCPALLQRSASPVDSTATGNLAACVVGGNTESILWQSAQYPEPGVFAFMDGLVEMAFADPKRVDAFISKRAGGDPARKRELWQKMVLTPSDSAEFKALLFASLLTVANQSNPSLAAQASLAGFEKYARARRTFVAQDAKGMYDAWTGVDAYNKYQAARRSSGAAGMDVAVLGASPDDYVSYAWLAAVPDSKGAEFLEAVQTLGVMGSTASGAPAAGAAGFDPAYLVPVWKALEEGLDKFDEMAGLLTQSTTKAVNSVGRTLSSVGKGVFIAATVVQAALDLTTAITTLMDQAKAEEQYRTLVADADKPVSVKALAASSKAEDKQQLLLFWALATSPYNAGPKSGEGSLTQAQLCAQPGMASRCDRYTSVVTVAQQKAGL